MHKVEPNVMGTSQDEQTNGAGLVAAFFRADVSDF
jgi:hypothetical protein